MGKKHQPEEIIGKLREGEIGLAHGGTAADACRWIGITEQSYRWRKEYAGVRVDQARRMKDLERESESNAELRRRAVVRRRKKPSRLPHAPVLLVVA